MKLAIAREVERPLKSFDSAERVVAIEPPATPAEWVEFFATVAVATPDQIERFSNNMNLTYLIYSGMSDTEDMKEGWKRGLRDFKALGVPNEDANG